MDVMCFSMSRELIHIEVELTLMLTSDMSRVNTVYIYNHRPLDLCMEYYTTYSYCTI
jgi:hypothetical protein